MGKFAPIQDRLANTPTQWRIKNFAVNKLHQQLGNFSHLLLLVKNYMSSGCIKKNQYCKRKICKLQSSELFSSVFNARMLSQHIKILYTI